MHCVAAEHRKAFRTVRPVSCSLERLSYETLGQGAWGLVDVTGGQDWKGHVGELLGGVL